MVWSLCAVQFRRSDRLEYGVAGSLRLGRHGAEERVVAQIHEIDTTVEVGGWFGYEYIHSGRIPYRLRGGVNVMTNAGIVYGGARVSANGSLWLPVLPLTQVSPIPTPSRTRGCCMGFRAWMRMPTFVRQSRSRH